MTNRLFKWYYNSTFMVEDWANSTLLRQRYTTYDITKPPLADVNTVSELPNANEWIFCGNQISLQVLHLIQPHGHDIFGIAQGDSINPHSMTRNTAMLPGCGYLGDSV